MTGAYPRFRSVLDGLATYRPGAPAVAPDGGCYALAANESPYGPLRSVAEALTAAVQDVNRYPDHGSTALIHEIAARLGTTRAHVAVGCGSVGLIQMLLSSVAEPGGEVVFAWRSFEAYPTLATLAGLTPVPVPLRDEAHDLAAMACAITSRTRLVIVCNPNNPTGTSVRRAELERFLDRVPRDCVVALDEAYREYVRDDAVPDGRTLLPGRPNLVVLRTFSKAYGLAGLRVGYLIADPAVTGQVRKTGLSFSVNRLAQVAAIASLHAEDELLERVERTVKERDRVRTALLEQGLAVPGTDANFVWLRLGDHTADFAAACAASGVGVRAFAGEGVRISIGTPEANDAFLTVAQYVRPHQEEGHG